MEASLNGPLGRTTLGQGTLKIGRAPDNTLVINDPQSSAHHALVEPVFSGTSYQITDLNSTNGTFVNEQRLSPNAPRALNTGDVIRIGSLHFTYEASSDYTPTVAAGGFNAALTAPDQLPGAEPTVYQQPPAFGNYSAPAQPFSAPPQPPQPMSYPQPGGFNQPYAPMGNFSQPNYPQPNYPQPKKSRVGLWIGLIIVLLILIGGGFAGYTYLQNRSTPEKTLQAYCTALQNNDAQGIYNTFTSEEQAKTDVNKVASALQLLKLLFGGFTGCTYSNVTVNGNNATATLTITPVRGKVLSGPTQLLNENGQWKISTNKTLPTS